MLRTFWKSSFRMVVLLLLVNAVCLAQSRVPIMRHTRDAVLSGQARSLGRLAPTQTLRLVFVVPLRNQAALDSFLKDLYDPASSSYRQFLTVEEFTARFGPTQEDYDALIQFAKANGLTVAATSRNRLNLDVTGTVDSIEKALHVNMHLYMHPTENRSFFAPDREPSIELPFQLWRIAGLENYSLPRPAGLQRNVAQKPNATVGSGPSASFLGSDMRAAYYGGSLTGTGQSLGLLEFAGTDLADVNTYYSNVSQTNNVPITLLSTDGTSTSCLNAQGCDDTEQTLDITQALGMAPGLSRLVVYVGSSDAAIFNAMASANPLNVQLSSSWTWSPADPATDNPYFQEFAAQGQNLFQAAGDSGAWNSRSAIFPADDPFITSVGGTDLTTTSAAGSWSSESTWVDGGGGISPNGFAIPSWQTAAANSCSSCSKTLRNGPDVSANSNFTFYVCADQSGCTANQYGGTSFAAPMWAGYLALVNQQAVANGNKPVGFINPSLYSIGAGSSYSSDFHDILSGSNGHSATTGYDLATGWGSPHGAGLIAALAGSSSSPSFSLSALPSSVSIAQGHSGSSTITSTVTGGFNSTITLSASGEPSGVTVSFSPTSIIGAGSATMNLTVGAATVAGTYTITVSGTSGSTVKTTTVMLTVTGTNTNFTISASPNSLSIAPGNNSQSAITTAVSGGFNSAISLSASGGGSNVTISFNPTSIAAPGSGSTTMNIHVSRRARAGTRTITVTGTGGGVTHTTTVTLTIP